MHAIFQAPQAGVWPQTDVQSVPASRALESVVHPGLGGRLAELEARRHLDLRQPLAGCVVGGQPGVGVVDVAGVAGSGAFEEQGLAFILGDGDVFDAFGDDEEFAGFEGDVAVAEADGVLEGVVEAPRAPLASISTAAVRVRAPLLLISRCVNV